MIIYTDLYNRTKNYTLPDIIRNNIEKDFDVKIVNEFNPDVYFIY